MKLDLPTSQQKQKVIQNIDLKVRAKSIKLLKQSVGSNLHLLGLENGFLDKRPIAQAKRKNKTRLHQNLKLF